ncbi:MAG: hypothetical protein H7X86_11615, partial [Gorillibacterium sp.]|nr:hypothetical protein [Gorillibacterium sp.]
MPKLNYRYGAAIKAVICTIVFALIKGAAGWTAGSMSLIVDALNTISRVLRPIARKDEPLAPFLLAAFLLFLGFEALYRAAVVLFTGEPNPIMTAFRPWAALVALVFVCTNLLSRSKRNKRTKAHVQLLHSGLWPSVLALLGSGSLAFGAILGTSFASRLDALAALVAAVLILRNGWRAAVGIVPGGSNHHTEWHDTEKMINSAQEVKGIIAVKKLTAHEHGHYVSVTTTIFVNPRITVTEGQEIGRALRRHLMEYYQHIAEVHVEVLPYRS